MANSMAVIPDNEIIVEGGGLVPSTQSASSGDVLTVGQNGPEWAPPSGGGTMTAGDGISISEGVISAKVDGTTVGVNASGELEALGGGSDLKEGSGISIDNDKIGVRTGDGLAISGTTFESTGSDSRLAYRNLSLPSDLDGSSVTGDWNFGDASTAFDIEATAEQAGCQIHAALYTDEDTLISVSAHGIYYMGSQKTLVSGTNSFGGGLYWNTPVRPSGRTIASEFSLAEDYDYSDATRIALVAWDSANSQVVGDMLEFTANSALQFRLQTSYNSAVYVANPMPDSSGASQGDVLQIGAEGPEWATPSSGGGSGVKDVAVDKFFRKSTEGDILAFAHDNTLDVKQYGAIVPITASTHNTFFNLGDLAIGLTYSQTQPSVMLYSYSNDMATAKAVFVPYGTTWVGDIPRCYLIAKNSTFSYSSNSYVINRPSGPDTVGSHYYWGSAEFPMSSSGEFDTSKFDVVGDWSGITTPITTWYLGFTRNDGETFTKLDGTSSASTSLVAMRKGDFGLSVKVKANAGLGIDGYNGLYVSNPLPSSLGTAGQVLQVNSGATGVEWATPSSGSDLSAGRGIQINNSKIEINAGDGLQLSSTTFNSTGFDPRNMYRNISLPSELAGSDSCDWGFGATGTSFEIYATSAQAGCQIRAALYSDEGVLLSVSNHGILYGGMPKTLANGINSFSGGVWWASPVRPSGRTFADEFPLESGVTYGNVARIAFVAYDTTTSSVVGSMLEWSDNSEDELQFTMLSNYDSQVQVANPLPDFDPTNDEGKILKIVSGVPTWVTP